jgi:hypothetical protein
MKTRALLLTLPLLALAGCKVDNGVSVQMNSICAPPDDPTKCTFEATCGAQYIGVNALDTAIADRLWLLVQVNNQTTNNADEDISRGNSHDAYVEEIEVDFDAPFAVASTRERIGPYTVPASGTAVVSVFPVTPTSIAEIDAELVTSAPVRLVARTRLKGHYQDHSPFETAPMEVAIDTCKGCFDPDPCGTGVLVAVCPPSLGQLPASIKCEGP